MSLRNTLAERILVLDGAMGTMIQRYHLTEEDYRGQRFASVQIPQKGNNDLLCLTQPQIIAEIHRQYLEAGADIIELNEAAVRIAREQADAMTKITPHKPRFVVGSIGPTSKTTSLSPDVENPAFRAITFDELVEAYVEQMVVLIRGGVDALLIETVFDTLNAKAAIYAATEAMKIAGRQTEIMLSATVADSAGRTLSGQTLSAFWASVEHAGMLSVGLNCSFGAKDMKPYLKELADLATCYVSAYPNAGLPNQMGEYDEMPETMATHVKQYIDESLVNIIGGCCGTTPAHIAAYAPLVEGAAPRIPKKDNQRLRLAGLEMLEI